MREIAQAGEGASLIRWALGLRAVPDAMQHFVDHFTALATEAMECHPMNGPLRDRLTRAATRLNAAAVTTAGWYPLLRATDPASFDAYFNPRDGSLSKEARSDVFGADAYEGRHAADAPTPAPAPPPPPAPDPVVPEPAKEVPKLRDALRVAKRFWLKPGQKLVGSSKVKKDHGNVRIAVLDDQGERKVRIGVGGEDYATRNDDSGPWDGGPDRTGEPNQAREEYDRLCDRFAEMEDAGSVASCNDTTGRNDTYQQLRQEQRDINDRLGELDEKRGKGEEYSPEEYQKLFERAEELRRNLPDFFDRYGPEGPQPERYDGEWDDVEKRMGELGEKADAADAQPLGFTAELDAPAAAELRDRLQEALDQVEEAKTAAAPLREELDRLEREQDEWRPGGSKHSSDKWTPEQEAAWDALNEQVDSLRTKLQEVGMPVIEGVVPGSDLADIHYRVKLEDLSIGAEVLIAAVPHDDEREVEITPIDDMNYLEQAADLRDGGTRAVIEQLGQAVDGEA